MCAVRRGIDERDYHNLTGIWRLLRAPIDWPCARRGNAAQKRDELALSHLLPLA
jgi:hypothetical protein